MSKINALMVPEGQTSGWDFAGIFLKGPDFGTDALKEICKAFGISTSFSKELQAYYIVQHLIDHPDGANDVIRALLKVKREWASCRSGVVSRLPKGRDARELITDIGNRQWYGPIEVETENEVSQWYIRPEFFTHWAVPENYSEPQKFNVRWLTFARISQGIVSIHWSGFTFAETEEDVYSNHRLQYWKYIPDFFGKLQGFLDTKLDDIGLHSIVLHNMWDQYRYDRDRFIWKDLRIRAEGGGVALSARAGSYEDLDIDGIKNLAQTLRRSIDRELSRKFGSTLPNPAEHFDEVILLTLIQEFGALSYEFSLVNNMGDKLFRAHCY
ncbi:MAG: hypothetical protein IT320_11900, partial [Anaerolineae bacterium]|nr:hypothetical protein [Anaerolineae bacterium]